jgi:B12-binding domain/radical SAM domain protein
LTNYDVILIHPPAVYDFRKKALFPGALGSTVESVQFTKVPIGLLSLAEYLDRHDYKVIIDNVGDLMVNDTILDVEKHIKGLSSRVFAIGLHFQQHAPGAIEIARICKKFHPNSLVVMGGLTATRFSEEIIQKYEFVDTIVRGEVEKAFLQLMRGLEKEGRIVPSPNLTYRTEAGEIKVTPLEAPVPDLDEFNYTRFDLLQPQTSVFIPDLPARWSLEVCRGCVYNCAICGGSAYTYKTYLGRSKPAFRSPAKILADIQNLIDQGIKCVGIYQDPRMGGQKYWRELFEGLRKEKPNLESLSLDLLVTADEEFIKEISTLGDRVTVHICPDTGCDQVRKKLGRHYTSEDLLKTVRLCHKYLIPVTSFFSVGLAGESRENVTETWELWDKLSSMETISSTRGRYWGLRGTPPQGGPIMGPIVLDPGALAFDYPEKYGYKLIYKTLEEYIQGLSGPSWHQWLNYETDLLDKNAIIEVILQSMAFSIDQRQEYGFYSGPQAEVERMKLKMDVIAVNEVNRIMQTRDPAEREKRLKALRNQMDGVLEKYRDK